MEVDTSSGEDPVDFCHMRMNTWEDTRRLGRRKILREGIPWGSLEGADVSRLQERDRRVELPILPFMSAGAKENGIQSNFKIDL